MELRMNSGLRSDGKLALNSDDAISSAFNLYLTARASAIALNPAVPDAALHEEAADQATWASRSLVEQIVETHAKSIRSIAMKLALAVLESDTGEGVSDDADLQTRLTASAMRDAIALSGDPMLSQNLLRLRIA
jgi:hypothetical protein